MRTWQVQNVRFGLDRVVYLVNYGGLEVHEDGPGYMLPRPGGGEEGGEGVVGGFLLVLLAGEKSSLRNIVITLVCAVNRYAPLYTWLISIISHT